MARPKTPIKQRFWKFVNKSTPGGCWEWTGGKDRAGYGRIRLSNKSELAHRLSYELHIGKIPAGLKALHKCDNRKCVNPNHLFAGTRKQNSEDMVAKNHQTKGERHPKAKLTERDVIEIGKLAKNLSFRKIAKLFRTNHNPISHIIRRMSWKQC